VDFETIIGLELHAQVLTRSKMYCGCSASYSDAPPNTHVCPVCLGLPGVLPVINRAAVAKTIMTGLALNCSIPAFHKFDRKNYMYPDLMKGYQISQYDLPTAVGGQVEFDVDGRTVTVRITRVHLEEDTARLNHQLTDDGDVSLVDVNRSGVPLMEIVSEPDLRSPRDAREFLVEVRHILRYIGASTGNMEEGAFRCDANVSQRTRDRSVVGPKVEIKNMNSFRSVERALQFEVERQRAALERGETLVQETRGWVEDRGVTIGQRSKEFAHDYRYFPEPDLPPVLIEPGMVDEIRSSMPELPARRLERFVDAYGLGRTEARLLVEERPVADYFEEAVASVPLLARDIAHWITGDLFALARSRGGFGNVDVKPAALAEIVRMVADKDINAQSAHDVLAAVADDGVDPREFVVARGLLQVHDDALVAATAREVLDANPGAVADYRSGKPAVIGFLIGQGMRRMQGAGNPDALRKALIGLLESEKT